MWEDWGSVCCKSEKQAAHLSFFSFSQFLSWMEMPSQGSFNMNTRLIPMLWPSCELSGIFCKQMSTWKWQNVWNPSTRFPLAIKEEQIFFSSLLPCVSRLPKPLLLSGHLKFIKRGSMITFTHTAFDLLSLNYHKAVQRRTSLRLLLCATVIAFLILGGKEYRYGSSDLISQKLHCDWGPGFEWETMAEQQRKSILNSIASCQILYILNNIISRQKSCCVKLNV